MNLHSRRMSFTLATGAVAALVAVGTIGCITGPSNPAATQPSTVLDLATTQPSYWYSLPTATESTVAAAGFDTIWNACDEAARDLQFVIDRTDYRGGVMTTRPLTSRQWFEIWRPDVRTLDDLAESSLSATRRTIRFQVDRRSDGTFVMTPKVLVERETIAEQRITSVVNYSSIFSRPVKLREAPRGSREADEGILLPSRYWYPTGRDTMLEKAIAERVERKVERVEKLARSDR